MCEIEEEIDKKLEEKKLEADEKPDLHVVKLGNIKYISTENGVELLKQFQDMFNRMDGRDEKQRQESQRAMVEGKQEKREINQTEAMENLTFLDGVLLTWNIFNKILDNRLRDENGDPEKGICKGYAYEYLGIINDDITDLILNEVLEQGYLKNHGEHLHELFGIKY